MQRVHVSRRRPDPWAEIKSSIHQRWLIPLTIEYAGTFSILVVVALYFAERGDRIKQKH